MGAYNRDPIGWEYEIKQFFHEQGHELKDKMLRGKAATACPKDLERLRHNQQNYVDVRVSKDMYELNHELRTFAPLGLSYFCASFFATTNVPSMKHSSRFIRPLSSRCRARDSRIFRSLPSFTHLLNLR